VECYTKEQRVIVVKTHYNYGESYAETVRKIRGIFGRRNAPNQSTVQRIIKKFEETGSIMNSKTHACARTHAHAHNYAEMSSRISSKEEKCASGVVGNICRILCSTINRSVCTLY